MTTTPERAADGEKGRTPARVYTVPPGRPFLAALARAILDGNLPRPGGTRPEAIDLPAMTILLPTRRAARALQEAFLDAAGGAAMLLPQIRPIAEGDEELTLLSGLAGLSAATAATAGIPPAIPELERRMALARLVLAWSAAMRRDGRDPDGAREPYVAAGADTPAQALALAVDLARLMDMVETEYARLDGLAGIVPETFSEHWQKTLQFLEIVTHHWPAHLAEKGYASPMDRRNRLIVAEAERLEAAPPAAPIIVAGVTGSIPATARLMRAVMGLANGAIVLPGLDRTLDDAGWGAIRPARDSGAPAHPEHPQFGLAKLLDSLAIARADVATLPGAEPPPAARDRAAFVSEAMRPSATTAHWLDYAATADRERVRQALRGVSVIAAPSAQDEAEVVALILREAAETARRTAALVSPDRLLARRVAARLETWGIRVDDSAGRPFAKTVPGTFLDLVIDAVATGFAPAPLVAMLKHPLTRLGLGPFEIRRAARALEIAAFRTAYLGRGLAGVAAALERAAEEEAAGERREAAVRRLWTEDWAGARDLVARLATAFAPLTEIFTGDASRPLATFARAHLDVALRLSALPAPAPDTAPDATAATAANPGPPLLTGEAGRTAAQLFDGLIHAADAGLDISSRDYPDLYRGLVASENVRPRVPVHPRLSIWGPFEARLQQPDVLVLGSLNDGVWPESADPGPWLNRPMRDTLGLPQPEEKIGLAAHDFTMLLGAERVYLTRAEKLDGVPTVPSRWLMRIEALARGVGLDGALATDTPWLGWARSRDAITARRAIAPPAPRPPVADRPRKLSVSAVETWIQNPYAIFAQRILKLEPLPPLGAAPDASLRGALLHAALSRFTSEHPSRLPDDAAAALMAIARDVLETYTGHPRVAAFWLTRLERFAHWFAATEPGRRAGVTAIAAEVEGAVTIDAPAGPFTLTARADRIDIAPAGLVITDYKSGLLPAKTRVASGEAPQLPLEAAIAAATGFAGVPKAEVAALRYIRASGGSPPGEEVTIAGTDVNCPLDELGRSQLARLQSLVARFDDPATPYAAVRRARFTYDYDAYAHLARVGEWAAHEDGED